MPSNLSRHDKMVAAAQYLAQQGYDISRMPVELGKGGRYRWKDHVASDPALIPNTLGGAFNSVVIPRGTNVVIDADSEEASAELQRLMPPGLAVLTPTTPHQHFYGRYPHPETLPDVYEGGEVRRDPGGKDRPGGAGGMVIGPWSMTQAGIYTIADGPRIIPDVPEEVAQWLRNRGRGHTQPVAPTNGHAPGEPVLIQVGGYAPPTSVSEGGRYASIREYTAHLYNRGMSVDEMWGLVQTVLAPTFVPPLSPQELRERFDRCVEEIGPRLGERAIDRKMAEVIPLPVTNPTSFIKSSAERLAPPLIGDWLVSDLIRPGTIGLVAAGTGMGKSYMRTELSIRLATGTLTGPLFGHYGIPKGGSVLVFDGENGEAEEWRREDDILAALGVDRAKLGSHFRVDDDVALNLDLNEPEHQKVVREAIELYEPDLVFLDTIGTFTRGVEWGKEMHHVVSFLRTLVKPKENGHQSALLLEAHYTKVQRDRGKRPTLEVDDVMGQWVRFMDWVATVNPVENEENKVRWQTFKRVPHTDLILERSNGLWVTAHAAVASPTTTKEKRQHQLLGALLHGAKRVEGAGGLGAWLNSTGDGVTDRTLYRDMADLLAKGWAESDESGLWSLTEAGRKVVSPIRLVGGGAGQVSSALTETDPPPPVGGGVSLSVADTPEDVSAMSSSVSEEE